MSLGSGRTATHNGFDLCTCAEVGKYRSERKLSTYQALPWVRTLAVDDE